MSNMSYCRFENTDRDLADCQTALEAFLETRSETLSLEEVEAAKSLVARCFNIVVLMSEVYGNGIDVFDEFEALQEAVDQIIDDAQEALADTEEQNDEVDDEGDEDDTQH